MTTVKILDFIATSSLYGKPPLDSILIFESGPALGCDDGPRYDGQLADGLCLRSAGLKLIQDAPRVSFPGGTVTRGYEKVAEVPRRIASSD
jgi:hypothetical protein